MLSEAERKIRDSPAFRQHAEDFLLCASNRGGGENNLLWYFRKGYHYHKIEDLLQLVNVIKHVQHGEPLNEHYYKLPFRPTEKIYDWCCP